MNLNDFDNMTPEDQKPFSDPVVRCDSCQALVKRETLHKLGCCNECGNKRMRNLTIFNDKDRDQLIEWGFQSFVDEYKEMTDVAT